MCTEKDILQSNCGSVTTDKDNSMKMRFPARKARLDKLHRLAVFHTTIRPLFHYVKPVDTEPSLAHLCVQSFACFSNAPLEFAYSFAIPTSTALSNSG